MPFRLLLAVAGMQPLKMLPPHAVRLEDVCVQRQHFRRRRNPECAQARSDRDWKARLDPEQ